MEITFLPTPMLRHATEAEADKGAASTLPPAQEPASDAIPALPDSTLVLSDTTPALPGDRPGGSASCSSRSSSPMLTPGALLRIPAFAWDGDPAEEPLPPGLRNKPEPSPDRIYAEVQGDSLYVSPPGHTLCRMAGKPRIKALLLWQRDHAPWVYGWLRSLTAEEFAIERHFDFRAWWKDRTDYRSGELTPPECYTVREFLGRLGFFHRHDSLVLRFRLARLHYDELPGTCRELFRGYLMARCLEALRQNRRYLLTLERIRTWGLKRTDLKTVCDEIERCHEAMEHRLQARYDEVKAEYRTLRRMDCIRK